MNKTKSSNETKPSGKMKPLILSAAVFPGLGQFSQGKKALGTIIMVGCAICLYLIIGSAMGEINAAAERMAASGSLDLLRAQEESHAIVMGFKKPSFLMPLYSLIGLWAYSIFEIFKPLSK